MFTGRQADSRSKQTYWVITDSVAPERYHNEGFLIPDTGQRTCRKHGSRPDECRFNAQLAALKPT